VYAPTTHCISAVPTPSGPPICLTSVATSGGRREGRPARVWNCAHRPLGRDLARTWDVEERVDAPTVLLESADGAEAHAVWRMLQRKRLRTMWCPGPRTDASECRQRVARAISWSRRTPSSGCSTCTNRPVRRWCVRSTRPSLDAYPSWWSPRGPRRRAGRTSSLRATWSADRCAPTRSGHWHQSRRPWDRLRVELRRAGGAAPGG
jgi:hypothetical protein